MWGDVAEMWRRCGEMTHLDEELRLGALKECHTKQPLLVDRPSHLALKRRREHGESVHGCVAKMWGDAAEMWGDDAPAARA